MEVYSSRKSSKDNSISPERKMVWTENNSKARAKERKVAVIYYLSRNGHFEHPHFMEVPIPFGEGLYLRDVIKRLNTLRGQGMASLYSWSSKRNYKNSFVWHDLSEDDFIYPAHGNEYILKGSHLLDFDVSSSFLSQDNASQISNEYTVYKNKQFETKTMDACTQTEDIITKQSISHSCIKKEKEKEEEEVEDEEENSISELSRDDISPPSSASSSETMEAIIKADGSIVPITNESDKKNGGVRKKLIRTPSALMQLLACGSVSVKEKGVSLMSQFKGRMPRTIVREEEEVKESKVEDKEYFSGSLIELKKKQSAYENSEFSGLKRSSSCNAERGLKMDGAGKEMEGVEAKCIPRRL